MLETVATDHDQMARSNSTNRVPGEHANQPMLPLWVTPTILIVCIACGLVLISCLRRQWKRNGKLRSPEVAGQTVLLRPVEIRTKAQRPWQQIELEKLMFSNGGSRTIDSFPNLGMQHEINTESVYHADMSSAHSSPCVSPKRAVAYRAWQSERSASDFGLKGRSGLIETPMGSPPARKLKRTQTIETPSAWKPSAQPFFRDDNLLPRSQSLQSLVLDYSHCSLSRQRSDTDLRRLAMQNLSSHPYEQGSLETSAHQTVEKRDGNFIEFEAQYDSHGMRLVVGLSKCYCNRVKRSKGGKKDGAPVTSLFATVCLLPDYRVKYQTRIHYDEIHPQFNEQFTFSDVTLPALPKRRIFVAVYNNEGKTQKLVGACDVSLREVSVTGRPTAFYEELLSTKKSKLKFDPKKLAVVATGRGDILISLVYMDYTNKLNVIIMKARDLHHPDTIGLFDSSCDVQLLVTRVKFEHKKTTVRKRTKNPVWNEVFQFDVAGRDLADCSIAVVVNATDRLQRSYVVGRVEIGCRGGAAAQKQWQTLIDNPRRQSAEWHEIRN